MNHDLKREANNFSFSDPLLNSKFKLAKQTLNELIVNCDDYGVTFISIRSLALNTGKSTPTIQNHIEILESLGVLKTLDIKGSFGKKSHRQISFNVQVDVQVDVKPNVQVDVKPNVQANVQVAYTEEKIREDNRREELTANANIHPSFINVKLSSKNDTKQHRPREVLKDVGEDLYNNEEVTQSDIDVIIKFIQYRDEMFSMDKKYALKTYRAVESFMNEAYKYGDANKAFELMEQKEWASFDMGWIKK